MDATLRARLDAVFSSDRAAQNQAYTALLDATGQPVDWAYEVWDELLAGLRHPDNHVRAISAQLLANLSWSDPLQRMLKDFPALLNVTRDERFVTARHTMQSIWKVGAAGPAQQQMLVNGLAARFAECAAEKNCTLIRYDILECLWKLHEEVKDDAIRQTALALIETEPDLKYRKKYAHIWKPRA